MKNKIITIITLLAFLLGFAERIEAKPGKIKFSKTIIYEGEVENKEPKGQGTLRCFNLSDKNNPVIEINGVFNGLTVDAAKLSTSGCHGLELQGPLKLAIDESEKNKVYLSVNLQKGQLSHDNIDSLGLVFKAIIIENLNVCFLMDKSIKKWSMGNREDDFAKNSEKTVELLGINCPNELSPFDYLTSDLSKVEGVVCLSESVLSLKGHVKYIFKNCDTYKDSILNYARTGYLEFSQNGWKGKRVCSNGMIVQAEEGNDTVTIEYPNNRSYKGTLTPGTRIEDIFRKKENLTINFHNGIETVNGKEEKWIEGESFTNRHRRLSNSLDEDLVAAIECDSLSENQAETIMEERIQERKRAYEESHPSGTGGEVLQKWFGRSDVTFKCNASGEVYKEMFKGKMRSSGEGLAELGIEEGEIIYDCTLVLNANGNGKLITYLRPSERSRQIQRIHYTAYGTKQRHFDYVQQFCDAISGKDLIEGHWTIEDGKIILGKKSLKIDSDDLTITYNHVVECCTLRLIK